MPIPSQGPFGFLVLFMLLAVSVSKPVLYCFLSSAGWHVFHNRCTLPCRLFSCSCASACLPSHSFWVTPTAICPSPYKAAAPSASVHSSASHWYSFAKGGLLKERCWANGMIVLVIWKLPALCVCRYWQWCSRRIYGSSKTLVNFPLLVRCHLCTNEVIERALYAAAGTVLT